MKAVLALVAVLLLVGCDPANKKQDRYIFLQNGNKVYRCDTVGGGMWVYTEGEFNPGKNWTMAANPDPVPPSIIERLSKKKD